MATTEESRGSFSLEALLGIEPVSEQEIEEPEAIATSSTASNELLSALGLASMEQDASAGQAESESREQGGRDGAEPEGGALDLAALLGWASTERAEEAGGIGSLPDEGAAATSDAAPDMVSDAVLDVARVFEPASVPAPEPSVRSRFADIPAFRPAEERRVAPGSEVAIGPGVATEPGSEVALKAKPEPQVATGSNVAPKPVTAHEHKQATDVSPDPKAAQKVAPKPSPASVPEATTDVAPASKPAARVAPKPAPAPKPATDSTPAPKPATVTVSVSAASAPVSAPKTKPAPAPKSNAGSEPAASARVSSAVEYMVGERRPAALPERCAQDASAKKRAVPKRAGSYSAPEEASKPGTSALAQSVVPASTSVSADTPLVPSKQRPAVLPDGSAVHPAAPAPATPPASLDSAPKSSKRSGLWYLLSACLLAFALICTCYTVYASVASRPTATIVVDEGDAGPVSGTRAFRYSVQGSDGAVRTVTEEVRSNIDGYVAESTISFDAASEAEAAWFLDDAKGQFADEWVSGSVLDGKAVFTVRPERDDIECDAYEALLMANTTDCSILE